MAAAAFFGIAAGIYEPTFSNFLAEVFSVTDRGRGALEFPRELPGALVTLMAGALAAVAMSRVGLMAMVLAGAGLVGLALTRDSYAVMVLFMVVYSVGVHLNMPVMDSITLSFASSGGRATRLAQVGVAGIFGTIIGAGLVRILMAQGYASYRGLYLAGAAFALAAGAAIATIGGAGGRARRPRKAFVLKRRYGLYYVLCSIFGARKQIFMTFGPWVLIKIFGQKAQAIAGLWIIFSVAGLVVRPLVGRLIDRWGERRSLVLEGVLLATVCATYSVAGLYPGWRPALYAAMSAYVLDQLCFAVSMARTTYLSKIAESPEDIPGSLAAGMSIDHVVSMTVPIVGGAVWAAFGFQYVFWGGLCVALASSVASLSIRVPKAVETAVVEEAAATE